MGAPQSQLLAALRDVFGPTTSTSRTDIATFAVVPALNRVEVYSISLLASAAGAGTFQLIDATATGIGGTVRWQTAVIPTTLVQDFTRPLLFTKGLVISYTATAAVTLASNVQWSPVQGLY